jgi:LysR family glycine cleavage system transcriptional activator
MSSENHRSHCSLIALFWSILVTMSLLKLNALRAFAAVYEFGGIRPAGRALEISHSAVSRHVSELEAWLGVPLLEATESNRRIRFTAQGEALGRAALTALNGLMQAVAQVRESHRGNSVTIATTSSIASRWLLPRLPALSKAAPWVEVSVLVQSRVGSLAEQGAELALRMGPGPWPGEVSEHLMDDTLFPVMGEGAWIKAGRPHRLSDLLRLPLIHDRDPNASWSLWRDRAGPASLDVQSGARFDSTDVVLQAAAQGIGVALARGRLAEAELASGSLVRFLGDAAVTLNLAYWLVRRDEGVTSSAVHAVVEWLKGQVGGEPGGPQT